MSALKWIVKEAKAIKKQYPKRFAKWTDYVAQASAIYAKKHKGKSPVGKKKAVKKVATKKAIKKTATKKAVGKYVKTVRKGKVTDVIYKRKKIGAVKKSATTMHKDTKSHNVNIRVMSGISNKAMQDLKDTVKWIHTVEKEILDHKLAIKNTKELWAKNLLKQNIVKLQKMLKEYKEHATQLKKHI